ncbi:hypothetical protein [Kaarinaea lacus]
MKKKLIPIILISLISASISFATVAETDMRINVAMKKVGDTMMELFPIILNEVRFNNVENEDKIKAGVNNIITLLHQAEPHFTQRAQTNQISYDILMEHLKETQLAINAGNKLYAQNMLQEVTSICTSCHTQDDKSRTLFRGKGRDAFTNDFEYAEFNFLTRNYGLALEYYDRYLNSASALKPERTILNTTKKILTIYAQIYNQPGKGARHLEKYANNNKLTPLVKRNVTEWVKGLDELEANGAAKVNNVSFEELESYVHKYLGPLDKPGAAVVPTKKEKAYHVWLQGLLYKYYSSNPPEQDIPKLLYWLSINDRATNYSFYYSLADLYLKECMLKHTDHYFAKMCFDEYNEYTTFSYSGSLGTEIPEDVQKELKTLRDIVYGGKKK